VILRCTKKALDLLGSQATTLAETPPSDDDWYLNLVWVERRKCVLLIHAGTLFSVFAFDVRKADLHPIGPRIVGLIDKELRSENLPLDCLGHLNSDEVQICRTASRSILAFMNEIVVHSRYFIANSGGLAHCDTRVLNRWLRRTLHNRGGYFTPMDLVEERLTDRRRS